MTKKMTEIMSKKKAKAQVNEFHETLAASKSFFEKLIGDVAVFIRSCATIEVVVTRASSAVMIVCLFIVLFVFEDFFEFLGQSLATQVGGYDFALRIDKEIGGNSGDAVDDGEF